MRYRKIVSQLTTFIF